MTIQVCEFVYSFYFVNYSLSSNVHSGKKEAKIIPGGDH